MTSLCKWPIPIKSAVEDGTIDPLPSLPGPTTQKRGYDHSQQLKYHGENRSYLDGKSERNDGCC